MEKYSNVVYQISMLFITILVTEFLQVRIGIFSNTVHPRNMKFGLNIHFSIYFIKMF